MKIQPMSLGEIADKYSPHAGENGQEICWADVQDWCRSYALWVVESSKPERDQTSTSEGGSWNRAIGIYHAAAKKLIEGV